MPVGPAVLPSSILVPFALPDAQGKTQSLQLQTHRFNLPLFFVSTSTVNTLLPQKWDHLPSVEYANSFLTQPFNPPPRMERAR